MGDCPYSRREGGPLIWPPSVHTVTGNGRPLSWAPSAHTVAGHGEPLNWCRAEVAMAARHPSAHSVAGKVGGTALSAFRGRDFSMSRYQTQVVYTVLIVTGKQIWTTGRIRSS